MSKYFEVWALSFEVFLRFVKCSVGSYFEVFEVFDIFSPPHAYALRIRAHVSPLQKPQKPQKPLKTSKSGLVAVR